MGVLDSAHHGHLPSFIRENIEPGSTIHADDWKPYVTALRNSGYQHVATVAPGARAVVALPAVHRVASLFKNT